MLYHGALAASAATFVGHYPWVRRGCAASSVCTTVHVCCRCSLHRHFLVGCHHRQYRLACGAAQTSC